MEIKAIGLMSGTSLDGLDIVYCNFSFEDNEWAFELLDSRTIEYNYSIKQELKNAIHLNESELLNLHFKLGFLFANWTAEFINQNELKPELIASHGHTIFHEPSKNLTLQIGDGNQICKLNKLETICDFRSTDVALNGQGAPLVPIGDKLLFSEYDLCLNLGGIANISYTQNNTKKAYDICTCNMLLNYISNYAGFEYDKDGILAKKGNLIKHFFNALNEHEYYQSNAPKSMGLEWFNEYIKPLVDFQNNSVNDLLKTASEHIAEQIKLSIQHYSTKDSTLLITGGGVHNTYLTDLLQNKIDCKIIIPSKEIINFKEAIIFAFMGVLRKLNKNNILGSVTGASQDHSAGIIYWAPN